MKQLRIAQIAPLWTSIPPATYGGIELVVHLLCEELVRRGHDVTLFSSGDSLTTAKLHPVCARSVLELMTEGTASTYEYYANAAIASAIGMAAEFDILHFHIGAQWAPLGSLAPGSLFTFHTYLSEDDQWVARHFPSVALSAISQYQVDSISGGLSRQIPVIYNGCDFAAFEPSFEKGAYLAFLGRMSFDKNPIDAIHIAREIGMPILLAGRPQDAEETEYFETGVKPLIDGKTVRYLGPVNHAQKNELLRGAAALLFPVQWAEPFGLVMIEAMACGTPVVACGLGAVGEVIEQGITGFHAPSAGELAALVPRALELDRHRVRARAMDRFSFQRMVDDYVALYREILSGPRP